MQSRMLDADLIRLAANLTRWRKIRGLTTEMVAERASITRATLRSVEHGTGTARLDTVFAVLRAFGIFDLALAATDPLTTDVGWESAARLCPDASVSRGASYDLAATRSGTGAASDPVARTGTPGGTLPVAPDPGTLAGTSRRFAWRGRGDSVGLGGWRAAATWDSLTSARPLLGRTVSTIHLYAFTTQGGDVRKLCSVNWRDVHSLRLHLERVRVGLANS